MAYIFVQVAFVPGINYGEPTDICQDTGLGTLVLQKHPTITQPMKTGHLCLFYLSSLSSAYQYLIHSSRKVSSSEKLSQVSQIPTASSSLSIYLEPIHLFPVTPCMVVHKS